MTSKRAVHNHGTEDSPSQSTISKVMQELGRRGGQSTSKKKRDATKKSLAKARAKRWPKKKKPTK